MKVVVSGRNVKLWSSANDTYNWAHRTGASWPGSQLSGKRLFAEFQKGDLVDLMVNGRSADISSDEFNAATSDFLENRLPKKHEDYPFLVTRFQSNRPPGR